MLVMSHVTRNDLRVIELNSYMDLCCFGLSLGSVSLMSSSFFPAFLLVAVKLHAASGNVTLCSASQK